MAKVLSLGADNTLIEIALNGGLKFPFYLQTGYSPINLTGSGSLPFFLTSGESSDIPVIS